MASWALAKLDLAVISSREETPGAEKASRKRRLEAPECAVCLGERAQDVAFVPCGHVVCRNCSEHELVSKCPICRVRVERKQRIYY